MVQGDPDGSENEFCSNKESRLRKYQAAAAGYSARYADPLAFVRRQIEMVLSWGSPVSPGSSVLELGCADGFVTEHLVRAGLRVTGLDLAPAMVEATRRRLDASELEAEELVLCDLDEYEPARCYDVILGMRSLFGYVRDLPVVLQKLAGATALKLIADVNPRSLPVADAKALLRDAGFPQVVSKPLFVPQRLSVGRLGLHALRLAESTPVLNRALLRQKFTVVLRADMHLS